MDRAAFILTPMEAAAFVRKWAASTRNERAASQEHFLNLCELLGEETPNSDPSGDYYAFEKGAITADGDGFADVWLKGHFAWEYKGKHKDLGKAYAQLRRYIEALDNPPLLVVCDLDWFEVHTNWTNTESWVYRFRSADITGDAHVAVTTISGGDAKDAPSLTALQLLKALFEHPDALKPQRTRDDITRDAAQLFGKISDDLRKWGVDDMRIARFITKVMFCMFATDVGLLPIGTFSEVLKIHRTSGDVKAFQEYLSDLFKVMNTGGKFAMHTIPQFNGRMFEDADVPAEVNGDHIHILSDLDALEWSDVEPVIFGTLFERVLDPKQRKMLGAHYTSRADIELIVEPVLMEPLREEFKRLKVAVWNAADELTKKKATAETQRERAKALLAPLHKRLSTIRVLDPACGSGNFLYVSLASLKGLEKDLIVFADLYGVTLKSLVHPRQLFGIETNAYAHELASIVIWIGYLQWKARNEPGAKPSIPILEPLDQVEGKDAILDLSDPKKPHEATWPAVDVIVGNPPFLGGKMLRRGLGDPYLERLFAVFDGRVARESDLCCYWFEKARAAIEHGRGKRAGLLATQAIRGGVNRKVLERIKETGDIFYGQADRKWILDGAAVRVSMVGFDDGSEHRRLLNDDPDDNPEHALDRAHAVASINANLTFDSDVTKARRLKENVGISFMGDTKVGMFDIKPGVAKPMLAARNPHGKSNSDVVRPWVNGLDITRRPRGMWIIDFPPGTSEQDAAKYEAPFEYIKNYVLPDRRNNRRKVVAARWWIHQETRPGMRAALRGLNRYLGTPRLTKHRLFVWLEPPVLPDSQLIVFARSDDYFFGVLQSRAHEVWSRATGTQLREAESGFRYTPTSCFETFPFPHATKNQQRAIWLAAKELDDLRVGWLNPEGMIGAKELSRRTLTELYNKRPTWLVDAHRTLDEAVFAAYGWAEAPGDLPDAEIVARLLALNLSREAV